MAAYLFDINEQQVCEWRKNKTYQNMLQEKRQMEAKMQFPTLEEALIIQELDKYQYQFIATQTFIQLQALHVAQNMVTDAMEFSVSSG